MPQLSRLTGRERLVLELLADGHSNTAIAELLGLATRTVETHTSRIFIKLDLEGDPSTHRRVRAAIAFHRHVGEPLLAG